MDFFVSNDGANLLNSDIWSNEMESLYLFISRIRKKESFLSCGHEGNANSSAKMELSCHCSETD